MLTARDDELDKLLGLELGRRRLPDQALPPARARRPRQGRPAADGAPGRARRRHPRRRRRPRHAPDAGRGRRHGRGPDRDRVRAAGHAGRQPGPDLHPVPAARRAPRRRVRVVRTGDRLAHQEPAPQDRARSARAALRADGLRRRLPVRRRPGPTISEPRPERPGPTIPAVPPSASLAMAAVDAVGRPGVRPPRPVRPPDAARARMRGASRTRHGWRRRRASAASSGSSSCSSSPRSWRRRVVISHFGPLPVVIAAVAAIAILVGHRCAGSSGRPATSTGCSTRPGGSRTATTRSGSGQTPRQTCRAIRRARLAASTPWSPGSRATRSSAARCSPT